MRDSWPLFRPNAGPHPDGLQYAWEKAGLSLVGQPIPWNAEAVVVHGFVHCPRQTAQLKDDISLRLGKQSRLIAPARCQPADDFAGVHVMFRLPPPASTCQADLCWRGRSLGQITLPVVTLNGFVSKLALNLPTVSVRLGDKCVASRTFVGSQCQGLVASGVLTAAGSLAPLVDLGLCVALRRPDGEPMCSMPVQLASTQLEAKQALVSISLPRPRRLGAWEIAWLLDDQPLAVQRLMAISKPAFHRSLMVESTRFVLQDARGNISMATTLPDLKSIRRAGPCFLITSRLPGVAGLCTCEVRADVRGAIQSPLIERQEVLISDGPAPFAPGTLDAGDLARVNRFELTLGKQLLGICSMAAAPEATFDAEGGFTPPEAFHWSSTADEQLQEKLEKLLKK